MQQTFLHLLKTLALVVLALGVPWATQSQISGSSTGWCTDYEGNNFRCSDAPAPSSNSGSGRSYNYGGGCAQTSNAWSTAEINRENARTMVRVGNEYFDAARYVTAADKFYQATQFDPTNAQARDNLGVALFNVGRGASDRGDKMNGLLYHERAAKIRPDDRKFTAWHERAISQAPQKSCTTCAKALESDIAYGLNSSFIIHSYVMQATVNYDNCTRRLSCNDSDGASFRYLARESCYWNFPSSDDGFKACLKQGLEDRGWTFW